MFTNLIAKAYGVKDPNLLTTPTGIRNMRSRLRRTCMEEHKKKIKYLFAIKVFTLMELKAGIFHNKFGKFVLCANHVILEVLKLALNVEIFIKLK